MALYARAGLPLHSHAMTVPSSTDSSAPCAPHPPKAPPSMLAASGLQGPKRRLLYVTLYELIAIAAATLGLAALSGQGAAHSSVLAVAASVIAVVWNVIFNGLFERWEARQTQRQRTIKRRIAHAIGFEGGLVLALVPMMAWWFEVTLWQALVMDLGLIVFFLCYTFAFNWAFDRIVGLPASAQ